VSSGPAEKRVDTFEPFEHLARQVDVDQVAKRGSWCFGSHRPL
jgi:hypothetical protein